MNKNVRSLQVLVFFLFTSLPSYTQLIINEIYSDVAVTLFGDANGDGVRNARADEFIEVFNNYEVPLDISLYTIEVSGIIKHEFSDSTILPPKSFMVVFGGGQPTGTFGGSRVVLSSKNGLNLGNAGSTVILKNRAGVILDTFTYSGENIDASWVREPDISGDFVPHDEVNAAFKEPFSPGTLNSSFPYNNGDTMLVHFTKTSGIAIERDSAFDLFFNLINPKPIEIAITIELIGGSGNSEDLVGFKSQTILFPVNAISQKKITIPIQNDDLLEGNETFIIAITSISDPENSAISINKKFELTLFDDDFDLGLDLIEILADPPTGIEGDANQDGKRDAKQDEFLEFINNTDLPIDLSRMSIYDSEALRHKIPDSTIIQPNQIYLVFGGGILARSYGEAITQSSSTKDLSLSNSGDQVIIRDSTNNVVFFYEYSSEAGDNEALIFCEALGDVGGPKTPHSSQGVGAIFSPGEPNLCEVIKVSTEDFLSTQSITIYPNPTVGHFQISLPERITVENIQLVAISGKIIFEKTTLNELSFAINPLPKGLYFLKIKTNKGIVVKKILFE